MTGCEMKWKGCGRIDPHPGHHWYGQRVLYHSHACMDADMLPCRCDKGQRPVYWCKGEFVTEGGWNIGAGPHAYRSQ